MKGKICFILLSGIACLIFFRIWQVSKIKPAAFIPSATQPTLLPPTEALNGKIVKITGTVQKISRDHSDFERVSLGNLVLSGEVVATNAQASAAILIENVVLINLGGQSEAEFNDLLPTKFLVRQKRGTIHYQTLGSTQPISIRSLHILLTLENGSATVITTNKMIKVNAFGSVKLATVDANNNTHVWQLTNGNTATINDDTRSVQTNGSLLPNNPK